jgi:hypothetical protein
MLHGFSATGRFNWYVYMNSLFSTALKTSTILSVEAARTEMRHACQHYYSKRMTGNIEAFSRTTIGDPLDGLPMSAFTSTAD